MSYDGKPFGYYPTGGGYSERDKAYPSEIARQRPALMTRVQCRDYEAYEREASVRGDREPGEDSPWEKLRRGMRDHAHGDR